ncbi:hypothetical protein D3C76_987100 [compost metagenome]
MTLPEFVLAQPADQRQPLARGNEQQQPDDRIVAAQAPLNDRPRQGQSDQRQEAALDNHQQRLGQRQEPARPAQQPEQEQALQRSATQAGNAAPVLHCREQEASDDGDGESVEHFVSVPGQHAARRGGLEHAGQHAGPQQQGDQRKQTATQEKRTETQGPDGLAWT